MTTPSPTSLLVAASVLAVPALRSTLPVGRPPSPLCHLPLCPQQRVRGPAFVLFLSDPHGSLLVSPHLTVTSPQLHCFMLCTCHVTRLLTAAVAWRGVGRHPSFSVPGAETVPDWPHWWRTGQQLASPSHRQCALQATESFHCGAARGRGKGGLLAVADFPKALSGSGSAGTHLTPIRGQDRNLFAGAGHGAPKSVFLGPISGSAPHLPANLAFTPLSVQMPESVTCGLCVT